MFMHNMSLLDQIEAYFEKEKARNLDNATATNNNNNNATTATTNATTTTATETNSSNGRRLTVYAGAKFDAELRDFYKDIIWTRMEQIWEHPGVFDLPEEPVDEDDRIQQHLPPPYFFDISHIWDSYLIRRLTL